MLTDSKSPCCAFRCSVSSIPCVTGWFEIGYKSPCVAFCCTWWTILSISFLQLGLWGSSVSKISVSFLLLLLSSMKVFQEIKFYIECNALCKTCSWYKLYSISKILLQRKMLLLPMFFPYKPFWMYHTGLFLSWLGTILSEAVDRAVTDVLYFGFSVLSTLALSSVNTVKFYFEIALKKSRAW